MLCKNCRQPYLRKLPPQAFELAIALVQSLVQHLERLLGAHVGVKWIAVSMRLGSAWSQTSSGDIRYYPSDNVSTGDLKPVANGDRKLILGTISAAEAAQ